MKKTLSKIGISYIKLTEKIKEIPQIASGVEAGLFFVCAIICVMSLMLIRTIVHSIIGN